MTIKKIALLSLILSFQWSLSQNFTGVYKIDQLLKRIDNPDTTYVINFWATWCKPCVKELPGFDSLASVHADSKVKVILVSLDFSEELEKKVKPFLAVKKIKAECILLDEVNGNDFVNKVSPEWSGAIPATLFKKNKLIHFKEKKMDLAELEEQLKLLH